MRKYADLKDAGRLEEALGAYQEAVNHNNALLGSWRMLAEMHSRAGRAQLAQFACLRTQDVARHDGRGRLAERTGFDVMGEIRDGIAVHLDVDRHGRAAQLGVRGRGRVRVRQAADSRNVSGEFENFAVVDVVDHVARASRRGEWRPFSLPPGRIVSETAAPI